MVTVLKTIYPGCGVRASLMLFKIFFLDLFIFKSKDIYTILGFDSVVGISLTLVDLNIYDHIYFVFFLQCKIEDMRFM